VNLGGFGFIRPPFRKVNTMNNLTTRPLYEIAGEIETILAADEWNDEQIEALDRLTLTLEAKAGNIAALIHHAEASAIFQDHSPTWFSPPFPQAGRCKLSCQPIT